MIGPGYTPDTGLLFAIGVSSLPVTMVVTTRGNLSFGTKLKSFWWEDKVRMNVLAGYTSILLKHFDPGIPYLCIIFGVGYLAC